MLKILYYKLIKKTFNYTLSLIILIDLLIYLYFFLNITLLRTLSCRWQYCFGSVNRCPNPFLCRIIHNPSSLNILTTGAASAMNN